MKLIKRILFYILLILLFFNLFLIISGKTYLYKGVANTYLKGRSGPSIDEVGIFDNRIIKSENHSKWALGKDYNKVQFSDEERKKMDSLETIAFLVIKDDSIRYEEYRDGFSDTSTTNSFSMAKTFVGILAGIAIEEGKIKSLDQPVSDYFAQFKDGIGANLTIRHLVTMSSGINFDEDYVNPFAYPAAAYYGSDLQKLTLKYKVTEQPGKTFKYLSGNTALLSFIIEKATGKTLSEYASEKLWNPIEAEHDASWSLDRKDGVEKAYCCFNSNARDFARIGKLYLDSGIWNGNQIVPKDYVLESIRPADLVEESGSPNNEYGYAWWIIPSFKNHYVYYARGILGQYIFVIPDKKMVVVRLGKKRMKHQTENHPDDVYYYLNIALSNF